MVMMEWWESLSIAGKVFYCTAIPATLILLIQTVMLFLGIGGEAEGGDLPDDLPDGDAGDGVFGEDSVSDMSDAEGMEGLRVFTVRGIVAFFVVFGWLGVALDAADVALYITLPVAIGGGLLMMVVLAFLMRAVMKLRSDGNLDNRNAVGTAGKVYLTVPPSRSGEGKVQIMLQGSYVERDAVTDETEAIPTGSEVVVVGVSGDTDLVVARK